MEKPPGEVFVYCNGASYLLSAIIQSTTKMRTIDFAKENLFTPLGISDILWDTSPQGIDIGWGRMWLKPLDLAKFGWLYLINTDISGGLFLRDIILLSEQTANLYSSCRIKASLRFLTEICPEEVISRSPTDCSRHTFFPQRLPKPVCLPIQRKKLD
jgi:hypothetical protein